MPTKRGSKSTSKSSVTRRSKPAKRAAKRTTRSSTRKRRAASKSRSRSGSRSKSRSRSGSRSGRRTRVKTWWNIIISKANKDSEVTGFAFSKGRRNGQAPTIARAFAHAKAQTNGTTYPVLKPHAVQYLKTHFKRRSASRTTSASAKRSTAGSRKRATRGSKKKTSAKSDGVMSDGYNHNKMDFEHGYGYDNENMYDDGAMSDGHWPSNDEIKSGLYDGLMSDGKYELNNDYSLSAKGRKAIADLEASGGLFDGNLSDGAMSDGDYDCGCKD